MGEFTAISWCDHTFNPWVGCTKVSPACDGCYAEHLMATRLGRVEWGGPGANVGTRERTSAANWRKPLAWDRAAAKAGTRPFVFCASLADVFDNAVPPEWRRDLFQLIRETPNLTWLLLTKRPGNIAKLFSETITPELRKAWEKDVRRLGQTFWPPNAAIGCTVVTQEEADRDVPKLLAAKAGLKPAFAFLSMEPLMGPVWLGHTSEDGKRQWNWLSGDVGTMYPDGPDFDAGPKIDWVITGGETDQGKHKARPSHPEWFRSLRRQCGDARVAFHHKQNGEWSIGGGRAHFKELIDAPWQRVGSQLAGVRPQFMVKDGKTAAGRLLDGVEHNARPEPRS